MDKKPDLESEKIYVSAAASLGQVINELSDSYASDHPIEIVHNYASSGALARQILYGAPTDVFISADRKWTRHLDSMDHVIGNSHNLLENTLVIVSNMESPLDEVDIEEIPDLFQSDLRIAVGDTSHVPVGRYSMDALRKSGVNHIAPGKCLVVNDVTAVLRLVELKEADIGIVYNTVALQSDKIKVLYTFPRSQSAPIIYDASLLSTKSSASKFFQYLTSPDVHTTWKKYGFIPYDD